MVVGLSGSLAPFAGFAGLPGVGGGRCWVPALTVRCSALQNLPPGVVHLALALHGHHLFNFRVQPGTHHAHGAVLWLAGGTYRARHRRWHRWIGPQLCRCCLVAALDIFKPWQ